MGIRHAAVKVEGDKGYSSEWNADHIDSSSGTQYWSCSGAAFHLKIDANIFLTLLDESENWQMGNDDEAVAAVNLPNGAIVTGVIVYTDAGTAVWELKRKRLSDGTNVTMASAAVNVEDTTISNATIDNSLYAYYLFMASNTGVTDLYGARITYTL